MHCVIRTYFARLKVLDMDAGKVWRTRQTEFAGDWSEPGGGSQPREYGGAGERGRVAEDLRAPGAGQGVGERRPGPEPPGEHAPAQGRGCAGAGARGAGVLPHPLGPLLEVRADDEAQLGPGASGTAGAGPVLGSGQGLCPVRGGRGGVTRPRQRPRVADGDTGGECPVLVEHGVIHPHTRAESAEQGQISLCGV